MTYLPNCNWIKKSFVDSNENHRSTIPSLFKRTVPKILKIKNSILFTIIFVAFAQVCWGQANYFYKSKGSGNWNTSGSSGIWSSCVTLGGTYTDATIAPSSTNDVTIQAGHTITSDVAACFARSLTINTIGTLVCTGSSNLTVNGSFANNGTFTATSGIFTMAGSTATTISVGSESSIIFNELVISNSNSTSGVQAQTSFAVSQNMTINAKSYFSTLNNEIFTISGDFTNNGTFKCNKSTIIMAGDNLKQITGSASIFTFYNLSIENTGGISSDKNFSVLGDMTIMGSCSFILGSSNKIKGIGTGLSRLSGPGTVYVTGINEALNGDYVGQYDYFIRSVDNVIYKGGDSGEQTITPISYGTLEIFNINGCNISGGVTCQTLKITEGVLTVKPEGTLIVKGATNLNYSATVAPPLQKHFESCLVLQSDESSTGSYKFSYKADYTPNIDGIGNMRVERYMSIDDHWHLYCSPMKNQSIHDFLKYNPEIPNLYNVSNENIGLVSMQEYDTENDQWKLYPFPNYPLNSYFVYDNTSTLLSSMSNGKGFSISTIPDDTKNGTIEATGIPNNELVNTPILGINKGWNCIGNPYTCAIVVASFLDANKNNDLTTEVPFQNLYLWDETKSGYFPASGYVQAGQGFFIKSRPAGGFAHFTSAMQSVANIVPFKSATFDLPSISLITQFQTLRSTTQISFVANATKGLDPGFDAGMLKANKDFALYSRLIEDIGVDFCLQSLPDKDFDQYVIPIGIDFKVGGELTFTAETVNLPSGCQALLEDRLTKKFTRLDLKDAKYTVTVSANTKGTGRFFLHTSDVISGDQSIQKEQFKISKIGKTLYINGEVSDKANFFVYSVNGKQLANFKAESQIQNQFDASGLPAGVYILTVDDKSQKKSIKFVIEN